MTQPKTGSKFKEFPGNFCSRCEIEYEDNVAVRVAHCRLHEAAPEMYELLETIEQLVAGDTDLNDYADMLGETARRIKAAIDGGEI